jgi:phosphate transport system protein
VHQSGTGINVAIFQGHHIEEPIMNSKLLHDDLDLLKAMLARSFDLVALQLSDATKALMEQDEVRARQVHARDSEIDGLEIEIDRKCEQMLETHKPGGAALRTIVTSIKINTDLERIGDHGSNMAKHVPLISDLPRSLLEEAGVETLALSADRILWEARNAFLSEDPDAAKKLLQLDREVNLRFRDAFEHLVRLQSKYAEYAASLSYLTIIVKSIERLSDHLINIAESVVFRVSGVDIRHQ